MVRYKPVKGKVSPVLVSVVVFALLMLLAWVGHVLQGAGGAGATRGEALAIQHAEATEQRPGVTEMAFR